MPHGDLDAVGIDTNGLATHQKLAAPEDQANPDRQAEIGAVLAERGRRVCAYGRRPGSERDPERADGHDQTTERPAVAPIAGHRCGAGIQALFAWRHREGRCASADQHGSSSC
jgi:hypothetical protein